MMSNERLFLESVTGIDIDRVALNAYAQVSAETGLSINDVAANGYCADCSEFMLGHLNARFKSQLGFCAYRVVHDISDYMEACGGVVSIWRTSLL